jgi:hypothetical protein
LQLGTKKRASSHGGRYDGDEGDFAMRETLSQRLADVVLPDADGKEFRLGGLWEKQAAVIVFLRHYG